MPRLRYPLLDEDRLLKSKIVFSAFRIEPPGFEGIDEIGATETYQALSNRVQNVGNRIGLTTAPSVGVNTVDTSTAEGVLNASALTAEGIARRKPAPSVSAMQIFPLGDIVDLYLPQAQQVVDILNYDNATSLNISGASFLRGANAGSGALQSLAKGIIEGTQSITNFFTEGTAGVAGRLAATRLASSALGSFVPSGLRAAVGLAAQVTVNPNIATTFNGVAIRQFTFQFKFLPKSAEESLEVKKIIKLLRYRAYPDEIPVGDIPVGYRYPDIFKIRLLSGKDGEFKNVGTPIKLSYLQSVQAVYNPGTMALHEDGSPTEIDLTLTFLEHRALNRSDVINEDRDQYYEYYGKSAIPTDQFQLNAGITDNSLSGIDPSFEEAF